MAFPRTPCEAHAERTPSRRHGALTSHRGGWYAYCSVPLRAGGLHCSAVLPSVQDAGRTGVRRRAGGIRRAVTVKARTKPPPIPEPSPRPAAAPTLGRRLRARSHRLTLQAMLVVALSTAAIGTAKADGHEPLWDTDVAVGRHRDSGDVF